MADRREVSTTTEPSFSTSSTNVFDVYTDYVVQRQIDAANVPPRQKLDISFSDTSKIGDKKSETNQEAYEKAHGKLYDMTHKNTIPWRNYVVYLILLTMLTCCFTYSKYVSSATGDSTVSVAKFNYVITGQVEDITITDNKMTSSPDVVFDDENVTEKTYSFTVTNNSDVAVNVTPTASDFSPFTVTFKEVTETENVLFANGSTFTLAPNAKKDIQLIINSSAAENNSSATMLLTFNVDQAE